MKKQVNYGIIRSAAELGEIARAHRKDLDFTLKRVSGLANVSTKFWSQFENGKDTAEIGKILQALRTLGLEVIVQPRHGHRYSADHNTSRVNESSLKATFDSSPKNKKDCDNDCP